MNTVCDQRLWAATCPSIHRWPALILAAVAPRIRHRHRRRAITEQRSCNSPEAGPRQAVREHPELTGTYLNLRAAELASRALRDAEDRRLFVAQVRSALADDIERGEPLQPVRLRQSPVRASGR